MLSSTLQSILNQNLQKKYPNRYSFEIIDKFLKLISLFDKEACISLSQIAENLKTSDSDSFILLSELVKLNYLKAVYKVYCPKCGHSSKNLYTIEELSDFLICEECEHTIIDNKNILKYIILMFQVI